MNNSFYTREELCQIGFKSVGEDVLISRKTSLYGVTDMVIGNHVRIDDFCILSGSITLQDYIHIAAFCALFGGKEGIILENYCGLSSRVGIYAESDDYSGITMTNPTIPDEFRRVTGGKVILQKHVIIGTGSTVMPDLTIGVGSSVGSMSLVNRSLESWGIYAGIPCRKVRERSKKLLIAERNMEAVRSVTKCK